ncbi:MAG: diheme cytochrome c-553 [Chitinophagaceae bacterium]|nr:diheme cytochrome c-553 [Chitinophagaceae bacterium]
MQKKSRHHFGDAGRIAGHFRCTQQESTTEAKSYGGYETQVKWGEHLVTVGACGDCHTPKKMTPMGPADDSSLLLSGHPAQMPVPDVDRKMAESKGLAVTQTLTAWVGPWGVSYSANLTPDSTGIGMWSEEQFMVALRTGVAKGIKGNRLLLPPMPWNSFKNFSDDELKAIFSYLKSTKPVNNAVPQPLPPDLPPPASPVQ